MGSNPIIGTIEDAILRWKFVRIRDLVGCERSRKKTHEKTVYLSTIRQVICNSAFFLRSVFSGNRCIYDLAFSALLDAGHGGIERGG